MLQCISFLHYSHHCFIVHCIIFIQLSTTLLPYYKTLQFSYKSSKDNAPTQTPLDNNAAPHAPPCYSPTNKKALYASSPTAKQSVNLHAILQQFIHLLHL